jgi:hypothetical protein
MYKTRIHSNEAEHSSEMVGLPLCQSVIIGRIFLVCDIFIHVRWVPCHHSMACSQVVDGWTASNYGG